MSEPGNQRPADQRTESAEGMSDREMVESVAGQTDSASPHADEAGKDWNGDPGSAPAPEKG